MAGLWNAAAAVASAAADTAAVIPAIPSMPSMKLKAFVRPTIQSSVSGQAAGPKSSLPNEPRSTPSTGPSTATARPAQPRCTANRMRFGSDRTSSSQLTAAITSAGSSTPHTGRIASGCKRQATALAAAVTATIASPPPRGVGRL